MLVYLSEAASPLRGLNTTPLLASALCSHGWGFSSPAKVDITLLITGTLLARTAPGHHAPAPLQSCALSALGFVEMVACRGSA